MEITPDHIIKLLADVGIPTVILLGILWVANTFAKAYLERLIIRLEGITNNSSNAINTASANKATMERVEVKIETMNQTLTEIKTILVNRIDHSSKP